MTDPVSLLNNYRVEILHDPDAFGILAYVLRNLSASSEELSTDLNLSAPRVANIISDLYRGGLISVSPSGFYFLRPRCKALLETLLITEIATASLAEEVLPTMHKQFLQEQSEHSYAHADIKPTNLLLFQICRFANEGAGNATENIWYKTLKLLRQLDNLLAPSWNALCEGSFDKNSLWSETVKGSEDVRRFWAEHKLPETSEMRDVVARSVLIVVTFKVSNLNINTELWEATRKSFDLLLSDSKMAHLFEAKSLNRLWSRCADLYHPNETITMADILSGTNPKSGRFSKQIEGSTSHDDFIRHLSPQFKDE
jgi:hypothetical protein